MSGIVAGLVDIMAQVNTGEEILQKLPKSANEQKSCIFKGFRSGWEW